MSSILNPLGLAPSEEVLDHAIPPDKPPDSPHGGIWQRSFRDILLGPRSQVESMDVEDWIAAKKSPC